MNAEAAAVGALTRAAHPLPALAVTAFTGAYAITDGRPPIIVLLVVAAIFAGQLSVGWSNDALDAVIDRRAERPDKPVALGLLERRTVWVAAGLAFAFCVAFSLALGPVSGPLNIALTVVAWTYNLVAKRTPFSPLPYAVAFGLLPAVVTQAGSTGRWPPLAVMAATALLGVAAHFANTVPDAVADAGTGVRGLPQRIGPRRSMTVTAMTVALAAGVLVATPAPAGPGPVGRALLVVGACLAVIGTRLRQSVAFKVTLGAVALVIAALLLP